MYLAFACAALAAVGGYLVRRKIASGRVRLTDDMIRRIEYHGAIEFDEPLDWVEIREEEERFWESEPWESKEGKEEF